MPEVEVQYNASLGLMEGGGEAEFSSFFGLTDFSEQWKCKPPPNSNV